MKDQFRIIWTTDDGGTDSHPIDDRPFVITYQPSSCGIGDGSVAATSSALSVTVSSGDFSGTMQSKCLGCGVSMHKGCPHLALMSEAHLNLCCACFRARK